MLSRARLATVLLSISLLGCFARAQVLQAASEIAAIQGKVLNSEGRPASGIHIELDDAATATPVTSTYTQPDGTFQVSNLPQGAYEVIATSGGSEVSDHIFVEHGQRDVELRLPSRRTAASNPDASVSVARMLVPYSAQKLYNKASASLRNGSYDDAEKHLNAALQIDPKYADALTLQALIELNKANVAQARELLERAIQADPDQTSAYITLAAVYNHDGRFDEAIRASEKGLSLAPHSWQGYLEMAKASIAKSMYQSGLKFIRQAQRLGGNTCAEVHLVKAYALAPLKLYKDAKYELQAALSREHKGRLAEQAQQMLAQLDTMEAPAIGTKP
jgi:lipopolysaccharide biosynthesis regulator YciM